MIRYCIKRESTGLYYDHGVWSEEPEWMDAGEARMGLPGMPAVHRIDAVVEPHEFSGCDLCAD